MKVSLEREIKNRFTGLGHDKPSPGHRPHRHQLIKKRIGSKMPNLFRYLSPEFTEALINRGELFFRSLSYFRDYEDEGIRADEYEGTLIHLPEDGLKIRLTSTGEEVSIPYTIESSAKEDDIFIYCLSTEYSEALASSFKCSMCVEILDSDEFVARIRSALLQRPRIKDKKLVHGEVIYYLPQNPPIVDWALPARIALRKPEAFHWQNEYRIAFAANNAFAVENVQVKLVPLGANQPSRITSHPQMFFRLGNMSKLCRVHKF